MILEKNLCKHPKPKTTSYGVESVSFEGSFICNTLYDGIEQELTHGSFENKIRH